MNSLLLHPITGQKKVFGILFKIDVSEQFLDCMNSQLSLMFEKLTGLKAGVGNYLSWQPGDQLAYKKRIVSSLNASIFLKYGQNDIKVVWQSKSGRIYELSDTDIDCADIKFEFENLDIEACKYFTFPKWSLFTFPDTSIRSFKKEYNTDISLVFIQCANKQLSESFEQKTGLTINKEISISWIYIGSYEYTKDSISKMSVNIYVNHNWNKVYICWQSKSGRIYEVADTDIDCADIDFWFEGLDPVLYHKQMFPKEQLPFKLKNLSYDLTVVRINIDCTISLVLKTDTNLTPDAIISRIDKFVGEFNVQSEKKDRKYGVVHNSSGMFIAATNSIEYLLDLGSTGAYFMKKLLEFFSALNCFLSVEVG